MHDHGHNHGKQFGVVFSLNVGITIAEVIAGILSGSLALVSDALHNASDVVAILLSFWTRGVAKREATETHTYGYRRAEILSAFVNSVALMGIAVLLVREAIERLFVPVVPRGSVMVIVGLVTAVANALSGWVLHHDAQESLNMRSSYLHLLSDAIFSLVVVLGGMLVWWRHDIFWVDPLLSVGIAVWMVYEAWKVLRETVDILMQAAAPLDYAALRQVIESVPGVKDIHHVHTWRSDEHTVYLEAHLEMDDKPLSEACQVGEEVEKRLHDMGVSHVTLQYETNRCRQKRFFGH